MGTRRRAWLIAVLALLCAACTRTVNSGSYGPFQIGESKVAVLKTLEERHIFYVEPEPTPEIRIENPSRAAYERFSNEDGILVWLQEYPFPLRIEFANGVVAKTWPQVERNPNSPPDMQEVQIELKRLQSLIVPGTPRTEVYDRLANFHTPFPLSVGNFVPGYQKFRVKGFSGTPMTHWTDEFRALLMRTDTWKFEGLKELVWYTPYYSTVTLRFRGGKLIRIEHFRFPFEVP